LLQIVLHGLAELLMLSKLLLQFTDCLVGTTQLLFRCLHNEWNTSMQLIRNRGYEDKQVDIYSALSHCSELHVEVTLCWLDIFSIHWDACWA
jgi:hypothetical protein